MATRYYVLVKRLLTVRAVRVVVTSATKSEKVDPTSSAEGIMMWHRYNNKAKEAAGVKYGGGAWCIG